MEKPALNHLFTGPFNLPILRKNPSIHFYGTGSYLANKQSTNRQIQVIAITPTSCMWRA